MSLCDHYILPHELSAMLSFVKRIMDALYFYSYCPRPLHRNLNKEELMNSIECGVTFDHSESFTLL